MSDRCLCEVTVVMYKPGDLFTPDDHAIYDQKWGDRVKERKPKAEPTALVEVIADAMDESPYEVTQPFMGMNLSWVGDWVGHYSSGGESEYAEIGQDALRGYEADLFAAAVRALKPDRQGSKWGSWREVPAEVRIVTLWKWSGGFTSIPGEVDEYDSDLEYIGVVDLDKIVVEPAEGAEEKPGMTLREWTRWSGGYDPFTDTVAQNANPPDVGGT